MVMINIKCKYLEVIFVSFCTFYVIFYLFISVLLLSPIKLATILYIPIFKCFGGFRRRYYQYFDHS